MGFVIFITSFVYFNYFQVFYSLSFRFFDFSWILFIYGLILKKIFFRTICNFNMVLDVRDTMSWLFWYVCVCVCAWCVCAHVLRVCVCVCVWMYMCIYFDDYSIMICTIVCCNIFDNFYEHFWNILSVCESIISVILCYRF